jgi:hypothetical protein
VKKIWKKFRCKHCGLVDVNMFDIEMIYGRQANGHYRGCKCDCGCNQGRNYLGF